MTDHLRLQLSFDDDGTAELFARVEANGFSGHGSAWIDPTKLSELGTKLSLAFPLVERLEVRGGNWSRVERGVLEQELLGLSFYPVEGRGVAGCQVRLASESTLYDRPEKQHFLRVELLTSYQELQEFSSVLCRLATGEAGEAILHAVAV